MTFLIGSLCFPIQFDLTNHQTLKNFYLLQKEIHQQQEVFFLQENQLQKSICWLSKRSLIRFLIPGCFQHHSCREATAAGLDLYLGYRPIRSVPPCLSPTLEVALANGKLYASSHQLFWGPVKLLSHLSREKQQQYGQQQQESTYQYVLP